MLFIASVNTNLRRRAFMVILVTEYSRRMGVA